MTPAKAGSASAVYFQKNSLQLGASQQQRAVSPFSAAASKDADDVGITIADEPSPTAAASQHKSLKNHLEETGATESCSCSIGWVLFALGFFLYLPFVCGALMPICEPSQRKVLHKRSAWIANMVMTVIYTFVAAAVVALVCTGMLNGQGSGWVRGTEGGSQATDMTFQGSTNGVMKPGFL